jgi:hypothetical protein
MHPDFARFFAATAQAAANRPRPGTIRHLCDCETQWRDTANISACPSCGRMCSPAPEDADMFAHVRGQTYEPTPARFHGFEKLGL